MGAGRIASAFLERPAAATAEYGTGQHVAENAGFTLQG
jgi:hypothetical protein